MKGEVGLHSLFGVLVSGARAGKGMTTHTTTVRNADGSTTTTTTTTFTNEDAENIFREVSLPLHFATRSTTQGLRLGDQRDHLEDRSDHRWW